jgi:ATP-dependent protease HslVU (ClpYQ) peptidase subunit
MTIIVGYKDKKNKKVIIGGDTNATGGWHTSRRLDGKTFTVHGISYGFTSSYRMGQIIKYHMPELLSTIRKKDPFNYVVSVLVPEYRRLLKAHGYNGEYDSHNDVSGRFIIAIDGNLFAIDNDFQVIEPRDDYFAVGCGSEYALGSLYQTSTDKDTSIKDKVIKALDCACYFSAGCGGEYTFEEN